MDVLSIIEFYGQFSLSMHYKILEKLNMYTPTEKYLETAKVQLANNSSNGSLESCGGWGLNGIKFPC